MADRRSYSGLMRYPAFGLYDGRQLVATVRAADAFAARNIFRHAGLEGERVRRIDHPAHKTRGSA